MIAVTELYIKKQSKGSPNIQSENKPLGWLQNWHHLQGEWMNISNNLWWKDIGILVVNVSVNVIYPESLNNSNFVSQ